MIAGLNLKSEGESVLAILDNNLEILRLDTNEDIVENLPEKLDVLAVNTSFKSIEGLTEEEKDLIDEGFHFNPSTYEKNLNRRAVHLKQLIFEKGLEIELIRFDEMISSKELAIDGDKALQSYGLDTSDIKSSDEFDAVIGAVTARFYQQDQCKDLGVQVPQEVKQKT